MKRKRVTCTWTSNTCMARTFSCEPIQYVLISLRIIRYKGRKTVCNRGILSIGCTLYCEHLQKTLPSYLPPIKRLVGLQCRTISCLSCAVLHTPTRRGAGWRHPYGCYGQVFPVGYCASPFCGRNRTYGMGPLRQFASARKINCR